MVLYYASFPTVHSFHYYKLNKEITKKIIKYNSVHSSISYLFLFLFPFPNYLYLLREYDDEIREQELRLFHFK